jgi:hypothetical protein
MTVQGLSASTRPRAGGKPPPVGAAGGCSRQGRERGLAETFASNCLAWTLAVAGGCSRQGRERDQEANG